MSYRHPMSLNKIRQSHKAQQGVVLVVALFIVALVAVMAYVMMSRLERDTRRTSLILRNVEAEYLAQGSIAWAMDQLRKDWEQQKKDTIIDPMPIQSPVLNVNGYKIFSTIDDLQARFNLNNVNNPQTQADFARLLCIVYPRLKEEEARSIALATYEWITNKHEENKYDAELLAYRSAHRLMLSVSEWQLVQGVTPELYNALQPYITALPVTTPVNVQSALAPVLTTLSPSMTLETAQTIEKARAQTPFTNMQSFLNLDVMKNHNMPNIEEKATIFSSYFLVATNVSIEKQQLLLYTLLERNTKNGKADVHILWQSKSSSG